MQPGSPKDIDTRPIHLPSLTSLRWFAATAVFLRHASIGAHLGPQGATGVSFFFILSGFVLTWSFRPRQSKRDFLVRRVARIYPSYAVVTLVVIPLYFLVGRFNDVGQAVRGLFTLTLLQSWIPDPEFYFAGNGVSWSLADEAFFYATFPALIVFVSSRTGRIGSQRRLLAGTVALLSIGVLVPVVLHPSGESGLGFWFIYINPAFRLVEFMVGICLALLVQRGGLPRLPLAPCALLAAAAYLAAGWVPLWAMWSATTLVPFSLLIVAAVQADIAGRTNSVLGNSALLKLGTWSFAFYLVHEAVITVLRSVANKTGLGVSVLVLAAASYLIGIALSAFVYLVVEQPGQRWFIRRTSGGPASVGS